MLERPVTTQRLTQAIVLAGKEASMVRRKVLGRCLIPFPFIVGMGIFWIANTAAADELRCIQLGNNCIASEPLNTNSYTQIQANAFFAANDGGTKKMTLAPGTYSNAVGEDPGNFAGRYSFPNSSGDATMFAALPSGHSVTFVLKTPSGNDHADFLGHKFGSGDPTARRSMRWYQYFASGWELSGGACLNSGKIFELGNEGAPMVFTSAGNHQIYGFNDCNISPFDCCNGGPGSQAFSMSPATMNGKWWRFELVVRNALSTGGVTIVELWRKNVSDNGTNTKVLDTAATAYGPGTGGNNWTSTQATTLKPRSRLDAFRVTPWRNGNCGGYLGYSHLLAAAWSTDAGQFIGAAAEIEGGLPAPTNIPAPANLR